MLPLRHKSLWVAASVVLVALVVAGSLVPGPAIPAPGNFDKLEHFGVYAFLAVWFTALYPRPAYWRVALGLLALGLLLEALQQAMGVGRMADTRDVVANAAGVLIGCGLGTAATGGWAMRIDAWLSRS